jgi:hypothetical protein
MNHILTNITYIRILRIYLNTYRYIKHWLLFFFWKFIKGADFILVIGACNCASSYHSIFIFDEQKIELVWNVGYRALKRNSFDNLQIVSKLAKENIYWYQI